MRVESHGIKGYLNHLGAGPEERDGCEEVCMVLLDLMLNLFCGGYPGELCGSGKKGAFVCVFWSSFEGIIRNKLIHLI